ncbi:uncharacterized protein LAESUDRAFT_743961 [Laetiporus sulphureus 93-53]|uniref:F-box domain-containing protein n=1 Tax=Laetiporus sulphureus 93-53 TaxID=1314785 RepID=A0A165DR47_9APHY|nr:uncharacterized protein LAESUDRAFT_743961 [Laetiporus sulphureus 93-53]KZT05451.1 hypothetical protein LAESUDRAFT_743961 [Laetiporus sulphureus 93-53]
MTRPEALPVELLLNIVQYLPLQAIYQLRLVSKFWSSLIAENESTVYRRAAVMHNYASSTDSTPSDVSISNTDYPFDRAGDWKSYCRQCLALDRNWAGLGTVATKLYCNSNSDVHRIKIDEARGLLITSHRKGGIMITDLQTDELLWGLSVTYARAFAHIEYDNGFLIFDRFPEGKEVWRLTSDCQTSEAVCTASPPEESQQIAFEEAERRFSRSRRGHFKPWALLRSHTPTTAFRFVYPTLSLIGIHSVYIWDVSSGVLLRTVTLDAPTLGVQPSFGSTRYVDVNRRHVLVCSKALCVFNVDGGACILRVPSTEGPVAKTRIILDPSGSANSNGIVVPHKLSITGNSATRPAAEQFIAAHFSRDGRHLVGLLHTNKLVLICDFERVARGEIPLADAALEIEMAGPLLFKVGRPHHGVYLSFEHGRVCAVTTAGLFIFTLDATKHGLFDLEAPSVSTKLGLIGDYTSVPLETSFPHIAACFVPGVDDYDALSNVSCLQMTATRLYMTYQRDKLPDDGDDRVEAGADLWPEGSVEPPDTSPVEETQDGLEDVSPDALASSVQYIEADQDHPQLAEDALWLDYGVGLDAEDTLNDDEEYDEEYEAAEDVMDEIYEDADDFYDEDGEDDDWDEDDDDVDWPVPVRDEVVVYCVDFKPSPA